nr:tripartite tricarboxylate transporter substrate binding protein [Variovorax boronicumulans]
MRTPDATPPSARRRTLLAAAGAALALPALAQAPAFPSRPIRLVVPFPPGGGTDILVRLYAQALQDAWGQSVVVDNRSGAGGVIGAQHVQTQPPDGHTLLVTVSTTHAILPHMQKLPFDPFQDFTAVTLLTRAQSGLFVRADHPAASFQDFVAAAKAQPQPTAVGDWGVGSFGHLVAVALGITLGFQVVPVHYRGAAPITLAVLAGEVPAGSADVATLRPHLQAGKLRMLAVNGAARHPALPEVPTYGELGVPDLDPYSWFGVFAPAGTPLPLREKFAEVAQRLARSPEAGARLAELGFIPVGSSPAAFEAEWRASHTAFGKLVRKTGIRVDG